MPFKLTSTAVSDIPLQRRLFLRRQILRLPYNSQETETAQKEHRNPELLPHFSVHTLRHTFCTRFCEHETNLKVIQEIMGHSDISTTMNICNEATKEKNPQP